MQCLDPANARYEQRSEYTANSTNGLFVFVSRKPFFDQLKREYGDIVRH